MSWGNAVTRGLTLPASLAGNVTVRGGRSCQQPWGWGFEARLRRGAPYVALCKHGCVSRLLARPACTLRRIFQGSELVLAGFE